MASSSILVAHWSVALLAEGVDRNVVVAHNDRCVTVALLAEGVDRNFTRFAVCVNRLWVALLAEGVDRNDPCHRVIIRRVKGRPPRGGRG